jgi:iron complex transport system substrate-binding protein
MLFYNFIKKNKLGTSLLLISLVIAAYSASGRILWKNKENPCPAIASGQAGRIISTSMASDEILFQILERAGQLQRLVAVSHFVDSPDYSHIAGKVPSTIVRVGENLEMLAGLKPDLVVYSSFNRPALASGLTNVSGGKCRLENFSSLSDMRENIRALGRATGFVKEANAIAMDFENQIRAHNTATRSLASEGSIRTPELSKPKVLSFDGSGTVMGAKTTFDDLVRLSGGINAAAQAGLTGWPTVNAEAITAMAPDVIVLLADREKIASLKTLLMDLPGWRDTPAVKNQRFAEPRPADLLALSPSILATVPAMRLAFLAATPESGALAKGTRK